MRFFKFILFILLVVFCCSCSFGYVQVKEDYNLELKILKELDIDTTYVLDPNFLDMQENHNTLNKNHFMRAFKEEYKAVAILKEILGDQEIPKSMLYLAVVESGLSNHATSRVKAAGIWQFMTGTAKRFGLRVDDYVDERRDPVESTKAAVKYLTSLKNHFGKWYLALMAYNCGDNKLDKAIAKAGTDRIDVLLDPDKKYLPGETRHFIKKILLTAKNAQDLNYIISNGSSEFNISAGIGVTKLRLPQGADLSSVAEAINMSERDIRELNAHIKHGVLPANSRHSGIYIPNDKKAMFEENFNSKATPLSFYTVKKGDSLYKIAAKFNLGTDDIKRYNYDLKKLKPKMRIALPFEKLPKAQNVITYVVQKGDTLYGISHKFDTKISDLKKINGKTSSKLAIGESIVIP